MERRKNRYDNINIIRSNYLMLAALIDRRPFVPRKFIRKSLSFKRTRKERTRWKEGKIDMT